MMLKFGRIAVVSAKALALATAAVPTKADAADLFIPGAYGRVAYGGGGHYGGYGVGYAAGYGGGYGEGYYGY